MPGKGHCFCPFLGTIALGNMALSRVLQIGLFCNACHGYFLPYMALMCLVYSLVSWFIPLTSSHHKSQEKNQGNSSVAIVLLGPCTPKLGLRPVDVL